MVAEPCVYHAGPYAGAPVRARDISTMTLRLPRLIARRVQNQWHDYCLADQCFCLGVRMETIDGIPFDQPNKLYQLGAE